MKKIVGFIFLCLCGSLSAQQVQYSQIFDPFIKTLEVTIDGQDFSNPVLFLDGEDVLKINFDELSHNAKSYVYKIRHCNADWTFSNISEFEYLDGINWMPIEDARRSINTTFDYTHYVFFLPNEQVRFKISGNYLIEIFEDNNSNKLCLQARFSVVEPIAEINASVRSNTDIGARGKHQQVDFEVTTKSPINDPFSEIKVCVMQNRRTDNQVTNINPTNFSSNRLIFKNNRALIFEAGNEYRSLDISNIRLLDDAVREIKFVRPYYHVDLFEDKSRNNAPYVFRNDVNGRFKINLHRNKHDVELETDYFFVHFAFSAESPFFDGSLHLAGGFNFQLLNAQSRMEYNNERQSYMQTLLLKQGGYNYQYLFLPKNATRATTERTEGNFWQTENEYEIFVYHRPFGSRYDRLIAYKLLNSR